MSERKIDSDFCNGLDIHANEVYICLIRSLNHISKCYKYFENFWRNSCERYWKKRRNNACTLSHIAAFGNIKLACLLSNGLSGNKPSSHPYIHNWNAWSSLRLSMDVTLSEALISWNYFLFFYRNAFTIDL